MTKSELTAAIKSALNPTVPANPSPDQLQTMTDEIAGNLAQAIVDYVNGKTHSHST